MTTQEQERLLGILDYWHKIEFFIPFGLDQHVSDLEAWQARTLSAEDFTTSTDDAWRTVEPKKDMVVKGFNLYLGIFDKAVIATICQRHLSTSHPCCGDEYEDAERTELEGRTCFAKIPLTCEGIPSFDSISISTVPWALGQTQSKGLNALGHDAFERARLHLQDLLGNFQTERADNAGLALSASEVIRLHQLLCQWAGFVPDSDQPIALLEVKANRKPDAETKQQRSRIELAQVETLTDNDGDEEKDDSEQEVEIDILNSFFIKDIERAIISVRSGNIPKTLYQYLTPMEPQQRIDLYSDKGREVIYAALQPQRLNSGHWLAEAKYGMSLMQQFAINTALDSLEVDGAFSVNGPPGTGKTTLLRDLFAENIVRRARILSGLPDAGAAFAKGKNISLTFKGESSKWVIKTLIPELTGFEMIVASSNNAAVENISVDLPKRKEIGTAWKYIEYLQPVAHKIAAQKTDGSIQRLTDDDKPWGLICAALGNARNRKKFCDCFFANAIEPKEKDRPLNINEWVRQYQGQSFADASEAFRQVDAAVDQALADRGRYAVLLAELNGTDAQRFKQAQQDACDQASTLDASAAQVVDATQKQLGILRQGLANLAEEERLIDRSSPVWWAHLFHTRAARDHAAEKAANANSQLLVNRQIIQAHQTLESVRKGHKAASATLMVRQHELQTREAQWQAKQQELQAFQDILGVPSLPIELADLEKAEFQKNGLWHDQALATLRSQLFAAALALQQAWVAEAAKPKIGLLPALIAISKLLQNKKPEDDRHILPIWQNLFMIVPVVSTTFASFANQFRGLGPGSLGWLYIDEAGQAVPQAAVGALWRAKRAVIVGDPLQIEPVFTLPSKLITALGRLSAHTSGDEYAPNRVSVQKLADQANRYGAHTNTGGESLWIGSPLRVHRRCVEPMFGLSNRIAYAGKMIYGFEQPNALDGPPIHCASCWVDIPGTVSHKQVVPLQIEFMVDVLTRLYQRDELLPNLYVISPFKAIRLALQQALRNADWTASDRYKRLPASTLSKWLKNSVGTVHTFQGKEQDTVFMLLGADQQNAGGAQWASSKPNLLNVALTRAKRRAYLVGDFDLWNPLQFFSETSKGEFPMERKDSSLFLASLNPPTTIAPCAIPPRCREISGSGEALLLNHP